MILSNINHLFPSSEVVSSITNRNSFICEQLNGLKYWYPTRFTHLQTVQWFQELLWNTNNLI